MPPGSISFITALHNCLPLTQAMLASLEATVDLRRHQVVLLDDASTDATPDYLQTLRDQPHYTLLANGHNQGFAAANNRAAAAATGDTLVFLNNDLELLPNWLDPMLDALQNAPQAGAAGNVQLNHATGLVDHAGIFFDLQGLPTHAHKNRARPPAGRLIERNAATAACLAIARQTFEEAGGFDETYCNGCEDVDLCMKLKARGYRIYVALQSVVRHHISQAPGRNRHNNANTETFRRRWASYAQQFGQQEWPREYLRRYARFWWRANPQQAAKALQMLLAQKIARPRTASTHSPSHRPVPKR